MTSLRQLATKLFRRGAKPLDSYIRYLFRGGRYFLLARYSGDYTAESVEQMEREILAALRKRPAEGLLMDFSGLTYTWGDDLLRPLSFHPEVPALDSEEYASVDFKSLRPFPVAYIVTDRNREGFTSLIAHDPCDTTPEEVLFRCQNDAVQALHEALDKEGCARPYPSLEEQRHAPRPTSRIQCRKCPAMILEATAAEYHGTCRKCARTKGYRNRLKQFVSFAQVCLLFPFLVIGTPFLLLFMGLQWMWRTWRFPFDRSAMLLKIQHRIPNRKEARSFLRGVIHGYWSSAPDMSVMDPSPYSCGMNDGGRLRRGEISPSEIPTGCRFRYSRGTADEH
ncbi:hypothetical protein [Roseimicrobium sp. ORNL1]|uniref:hypothetical protein n=1 Tax=Roseimicrobium sp. ORNL1 TaxID=2711231 RepID=UPI0013E10BE5|nr:hypothetical protein [Roseimicrobium sp. ORNL1]QIF00362.1 hypothetical protein G5S37_02085 [Roseimicrobium sp. ORNL1]